MDHYYAWAWTPHLVEQMERAEKTHQSGLILPGQPLPEERKGESAIAHFSGFKEGEQYSWIWLFEEQKEALRLRLLPQFLDEDDGAATLITATIPDNPPGQPVNTYLQVVPIRWLQEDWNLLEAGISEVWVGFNFKQFTLDRTLKACTQVYGTEEFLEMLKRLV